SSAPKINASFLPDDFFTYLVNSTFPTGDVDSWLYLNNVPGVDGPPGQYDFRSQHPGGANFLFCDGSARFLKETIAMGNPNYTPPPGINNKGVYRKLSTRNGGELISSDAY